MSILSDDYICTLNQEKISIDTPFLISEIFPYLKTDLYPTNKNNKYFFKYDLEKEIKFNYLFFYNLFVYKLNEFLIEMDYSSNSHYYNTFNDKNKINLIYYLHKTMIDSSISSSSEISKIKKMLIKYYYSFSGSSILSNNEDIYLFLSKLTKIGYSYVINDIFSISIFKDKIDEHFKFSEDDKNIFFDVDLFRQKKNLMITQSHESILTNYCEYTSIKFHEKQFYYKNCSTWIYKFLSKLFQVKNIINKKEKEKYKKIFIQFIETYFKPFFHNYTDKAVCINIYLILEIVFSKTNLFQEYFFNKLDNNQNIEDLIKIELPKKIKNVGFLFNHKYKNDKTFRNYAIRHGLEKAKYKKSLDIINNKGKKYYKFILLVLSIGAVAAYKLYKNRHK
jgi:hypothetical protein